MNSKDAKKNRFVRYIRRTARNKLYAMAMIGIGVVATILSEDATALAVFLIFGIYLFFSTKNWT